MKEEVERSAADALLPAKIASGQNLVRAGTECRRGDVVVPAGAQIGAITTALLAGVGHETVWARRRPSVAVVVTGDEVVHGGSAPLPVKIRDSNGPMLMAMACDAGITRTRLHHVEDTREALARILESTADADVVVLTGGVSAGNYDFVPEALHAYGVAQAFHKVAQQPGKPIYFGTKGARLFFGLPGTPLGCHLGFFRYVVPALRVLAGSAPAHRSGSGTLTAPWSTRSDRQQFVLAAAEAAEGAWRLTPLVTRGSSDLFSAWSASAYLDIPEGTRELPPNAPVTFQWLRS
jgi:molybdopterin molybdotransferase